MIPENITKEHVLQALQDIDKNGLRYVLGKSNGYDLNYNGNKYPPKHVVVVANEHANGELLSHRELTTTMAQKFLKTLGPEFQIEQKTVDPIRKMVEKYKEDLIEKGLSEEIYKWRMLSELKGMPDTDAVDFKTEMEAFNYGNLVYYNNDRVRKHILIEHPDQYRQAFRILFDETVDLYERILSFQEQILSTYRSMGQDMGHHHDERSIATFLTVKYPGTYTFYKNSFYRKYCLLIGQKPKKKNEKYIHYLGLVADFVRDYIQPDEELLELVSNQLPEDIYKDDSHKLLAQDILFKMLDKNDVTFTGVIDNLREAMSEQESILKDFILMEGRFMDKGMVNPKDSFVWIEDALGKIGTHQAHYEVSIRSRGKYKNCFFVDLHFEGPDKFSFYQLIGDGLPDSLEWIKWHKAQSIGTKVGLQPKDNDLIEKIMDQLVYLENNMGERIRAIIPIANNQMDDNGQKNTAQELNQILYGPPGTGKTYHTIDKALQIIDNAFYTANIANRNVLTKRFKDLLIKDFDDTSGQIAFCTFHQSLAYEDFIEGIKPVAPRGTEDAVNYRVADGIFKKLCIQAAKTKSVSGFEDSYKRFIEEVVENENTLVLRTPTRDKPFNIRINSNHNVVSIPQTTNATEMVVTKKMVMHYMMEGIIDDWSSYTIAISRYIAEHYPFSVSGQDNATKKYVLIIDEINRGNVSQIFGELITLIEDNKRAGEKEELEIILPYSAQPFTVPKNLYLIGTMNTADRSVEALDTALRRRFSFQEMPSRPELLTPQRLVWQLWWEHEDKPWNNSDFLEKEQSLYHLLDASELLAMNENQKEEYWKKMKDGADETIFDFTFSNAFDMKGFLEKINARLEKLLSSDHSIGHSYLMGVYSKLDLKQVIYRKIIPLLQEYFYGDLGKIGLALGAGFIRVKNQVDKDLFAYFDYDSDGLNDKEVYEILDYRMKDSFEIIVNGRKMKVDFDRAVDLLMGKKIAADE